VLRVGSRSSLHSYLEVDRRREAVEAMSLDEVADVFDLRFDPDFAPLERVTIR